jgi:dGTPase
VQQLAIAQRVLNSLGIAGDADLADTTLRYRFVRRLVGLEVDSVLSATQAALEQADVHTLEHLRRLPHNVACHSQSIQDENGELKRFLYENFYRHYRVVRMAVKAVRLLGDLFTAYVAEPAQLPSETRLRALDHPEGLQRTVCDYIAGMTDRYAILEHKRLHDPDERA